MGVEHSDQIDLCGCTRCMMVRGVPAQWCRCGHAWRSGSYVWSDEYVCPRCRIGQLELVM